MGNCACRIVNARGEAVSGDAAIDRCPLHEAAEDLLAALKLAAALFEEDHAISHFDWANSALRAKDIEELNDTPARIRAAIAKAGG